MTTTTEFDIEALPVTVTYVAEVPSKWDEKQKTNVDQWRVTITSRAGMHSFDYFTGLRCRETVRGIRAAHLNGNWIDQKTGHYMATKPKKPTVADVLYSLFMDASATDENFHDWCSNYGYSDDSIKAMNIYKQCLEIATALRKHFDPATRANIQAIIQEM